MDSSLRCHCSTHALKSFLELKVEKGVLWKSTAEERCHLALVYMIEHVKPQHSFRRVSPVLVRGEDVC